MTTEPKHTPEPWPLDGEADNAPDMTFAGNYERARDCVNACAGLPDIELRGATEQGGVKAVMNRLCADNERLREALRWMVLVAENLPALSEFAHLSEANWQKMPCHGESPDLCGSDACHNCGCIMSKLMDARAALSATERKE